MPEVVLLTSFEADFEFFGKQNQLDKPRIVLHLRLNVVRVGEAEDHVRRLVRCGSMRDRTFKYRYCVFDTPVLYHPGGHTEVQVGPVRIDFLDGRKGRDRLADLTGIVERPGIDVPQTGFLRVRRDRALAKRARFGRVAEGELRRGHVAELRHQHLLALVEKDPLVGRDGFAVQLADLGRQPVASIDLRLSPYSLRSGECEVPQLLIEGDVVGVELDSLLDDQHASEGVPLLCQVVRHVHAHGRIRRVLFEVPVIEIASQILLAADVAGQETTEQQGVRVIRIILEHALGLFQGILVTVRLPEYVGSCIPAGNRSRVKLERPVAVLE